MCSSYIYPRSHALLCSTAVTCPRARVTTCPLLVAVVVVLHRVGVPGRVAGAVVMVVAVVRGDLVMDVVVRTVVVISPDYLLLVLRRTE